MLNYTKVQYRGDELYNKYNIKDAELYKKYTS